MQEEIAKLYKDYNEILEKVIPLRDEYNFLVFNVWPKKDEYETYVSKLQALRDSILMEQEMRDNEKAKATLKLEQDKIEFDHYKNSVNATLNDERASLEIEVRDLEHQKDTASKKLLDIEKQHTEYLRKIENMKAEHVEYMEIQKAEKDKISESKKSLVLLQQETDAKLLQLEIVNKENKTGYARFEKIKKDAEIKASLVSEYLTTQIENERRIDAKVREQEAKLQEINTLSEENEKKLLSLKERVQEISEKEIWIIQKINEFKQEKFNFLTAMKSNNIKKSDIDKLDKEFNL